MLAIAIKWQQIKFSLTQRRRLYECRHIYFDAQTTDSPLFSDVFPFFFIGECVSSERDLLFSIYKQNETELRCCFGLSTQMSFAFNETEPKLEIRNVSFLLEL